jgi:type I restriction enzyme S subunit
VGKSAIMAIPMAVSQHFIVWNCNRRLLSNWFLYHYLQKMKPRFEEIATGNTIKTIGLKYFKDLRLAVPQLLEQRRIAECLCFLVNQITMQVAKIKALKQHKRGLMQQLFPTPEEQ